MLGKQGKSCMIQMIDLMGIIMRLAVHAVPYRRGDDRNEWCVASGDEPLSLTRCQSCGLSQLHKALGGGSLFLAKSAT